MPIPLPDPARRRCLLASTALATTALAPGAGLRAAPGADAAAFNTVLGRLRADYLAQISPGDADRQVRQQLPAGLWPDVDYGDRSLGAWRAMPHMERLRGIAVAFNRPDHALRGSAAARQAVEAGLRAWLARKPVSDNWWHNTIGLQLALAPVLVLMKDELPADLREAATLLLVDPGKVPPEQATGQNLVWYATEQLVRGALRSDAADLAAASAALQSTLRITRDEGIQPDYSFHQHGPQLYSGGYGLGLLQDSTRTAGWLAGTPWAFAADRLALLADYALQGIVPLIRGNWLDWGARGREFTRDARVPRPRLVLSALQQLQPLVPARAPALAAAARSLADGQPGAPGNRYYSRSDFMVHQTARGYLSVKLSSSRTVGTESGNGENLLGYWLPFGVTYIVRRGDEYDGLPPVWDWSALPGLTAPAETPAFTGYQRHTEPFVGGLSDGAAGVAALSLNKLQTVAKRAWFLHGDLMVALGAGIRSTHAQPVRTTLNQTRWVGDVVTDAGPLRPGGGSQPLADRRWVWHDGVVYLLLDAPQTSLRLERRRQGDATINTDLGRKSADAAVFTLSIAHGTQPDDGHYAYAVWLGAERAADAGQAPTPTVLANSATLQAVRHADGQLVQAVFHGAGALALDTRDSLRVDAPCLVQVRARANAWQVDVADPTRLLPMVRLQLWRDGQQRAEMSLMLPADAGQPAQGRWQAPR